MKYIFWNGDQESQLFIDIRIPIYLAAGGTRCWNIFVGRVNFEVTWNFRRLK